MKLCFFLFCMLLFSSAIFAQNSVLNLKTFVIQGQLLNYQADELHLKFTNKNGKVDEVINVDKNGQFYFESPEREVDGPLTAQLSQQGFFTANIFIAPGYNLIVNANCKNDKLDIAKTKQIKGYGAVANQYLFKLDSALAKKNDNRDWFRLNANDLVVYENERKRLCDSLIQIVFSAQKAPDEYYNYFKERVELDNKFTRIDHITWHTYIDTTLKSYRQSIDFVVKNIDTTIFSKLYNERYLVSSSYQEFMVNGYFIYLTSLKKKKSPSLSSDKSKYRLNSLHMIDSVYKGKIKYLTLYTQLYESVEFCRSWDELKMYQKAFPPYISELQNQDRKDRLKELFLSKESELIKTQIGKAAPEFTAQDSLGKVYDLADYKGKVVLLDLWASWCIPCRKQTPYLEKIVEKYKADSDIVFISVGILDEYNKWKAAMTHDKPTWLQLFDNKSLVPDAYVANSIPKFIVINKQGNIVSFDAPMPSDDQQLEKILDAELSK